MKRAQAFSWGCEVSFSVSQSSLPSFRTLCSLSPSPPRDIRWPLSVFSHQTARCFLPSCGFFLQWVSANLGVPLSLHMPPPLVCRMERLISFRVSKHMRSGKDGLLHQAPSNVSPVHSVEQRLPWTSCFSSHGPPTFEIFAISMVVFIM